MCATHRHPPPRRLTPPPPRVTFRRDVIPLWGPGQSPVLPFACCVGSLLPPPPPEVLLALARLKGGAVTSRSAGGGEGVSGMRMAVLPLDAACRGALTAQGPDAAVPPPPLLYSKCPCVVTHNGRLEEVAKAVGGGYCRLHMPLRPPLGARGTVAGHRPGALEGQGATSPPSNASLGRGLGTVREEEAH